ncbi:MAG: HAD family phosphatase [Clostridia bacterium]|nr:HAD family phosphatase [Clostridia bacterium]
MKKTEYLFDFDGTLVDSMPAYSSVMLRVLDENDVSYGSDIVKIITPLGYAGTAKYFKTIGLSLPEEEILRRMHEYAAAEYLYRIPAKNNVIPTLEALKAQGAGLHVLTASPHDMLDPCLRRLGMYDLFENVWSCDDFGTTKADPAIYKMAAEKIGRPACEILFLDDNYNADKTAKEAGMQVCGVYDASSKEYEAEIRTVADTYIYDFSELLEK